MLDFSAELFPFGNGILIAEIRIGYGGWLKKGKRIYNGTSCDKMGGELQIATLTLPRRKQRRIRHSTTVGCRMEPHRGSS